jgi:hypothetical protein
MAIVVLGMVACTPEHGNFPGGNPGGPSRPGGTRPGGLDAGIPTQSGRIRGRLCRLTDLHGGAPCTPLTGVTLRVTLRETGAADLVDPDGTFDLPGTTQTNPVTLLTPANDLVFYGTAFPVFLAELGTATVDLPVIRRTDLDDLAAANLLTLDDARGLMVVHVREKLVAAPGFTATSVDGVAPLYETADPLIFAIDGPTGPTGTILWPNVGPGNRSFSLSATGMPDAGTPTLYLLPTLAGTMTLAPIDL